MGRTAELEGERARVFCEIIRRAVNGSSQKLVAKDLGCSQQQISRILNEENAPTVALAVRAADAGYLRLGPLLDGDFIGADPTNEPPVTLSGADAARLREALTALEAVVQRLPQRRP